MARATIADVAGGAGVSKTAVSFAFNNPQRLSKDTLNRILEVAEQLGYSPDPVARSMSRGRTGIVGILVPQPLTVMTRNPFFAEFLEGMAEVADEAELPILLVPPVRGSMEHAVNGAAVDGFVTLGLETFRPTMRALERRHLPYVMVDSESVEGVACVNIDDEQGAYEAMKFVLDQGHRHIGILGIRSPQRGKWDRYVGTLKRRMTGYLRGLEEVGMSVDGTRVRLVECDVSEEGGRSGFASLWRKKPRPTAIIAMSDIIALGALQEAQRSAVGVPEELSLVGFDDIPEARWSRPPLTTIGQPTQEKGRIAAELLVGLLDGTKEPAHIVLDTRLIHRGSTAPPSSA